jgi:immune inhibitor A
MKPIKIFMSLLLVLVLGNGFKLNIKTTEVVAEESGVIRYATINRDLVVDQLIADGVLSPASSQADITRALTEYVKGSYQKGTPTKYDKMRETQMFSNLEKLLNGEGNKFGTTKKNVLTPAVQAPYGTPAKTVKVLVLLGAFSDMGANQIARPADLNRTYWTGDFSKAHYQQMLFGDGTYTTPEGTVSTTFKQYFKDQSSGNLNVEGQVYGWYTTPKTAQYYGQDLGSNHNVNIRQYIKDTVTAALTSGEINLADYDLEDPYDLNGNGNLMEPDGIVDHLMVIHPGLGQEAGGGVLGDDAIWSHSWSVGNGPVLIPVNGNTTKIFTYTTEAENGNVGLFTHEFVHDLGIPDDYDTAYTADGDIVEYWSLMAGGSWGGQPGGTKPSGINPYSRILLGAYHGGSWIKYGFANLSTLPSTVSLTLDTASMYTGNRQAVVVSLPQSLNTTVIAQPIEGTKLFYGGKGAEVDHTMTTTLDLTGKVNATLTYKVWFDIEEDWDGGFVQVNDGTGWVSLKTPIMKTDFNNPDGYPTIIDSLPAYTGTSGGWLAETIDLSAYTGKVISLRFRYATDWGTELNGMLVDDVKVVADGATILTETAETGFGTFTNDGWEVTNGSVGAPHYYVMEWRSYKGVDAGLAAVARAKVPYNRGLLMWYVNQRYTDNWVGAHPGYGQLGVVDAQQYVYLNQGIGNGNENGLRTGYMPFIQLKDAAFSTQKSPDANLSIYAWALSPNLAGKAGVPLFDDHNSYFSIKSPYSGLILPQAGLHVRVTGNAADFSRGSITIYK